MTTENVKTGKVETLDTEFFSGLNVEKYNAVPVNYTTPSQNPVYDYENMGLWKSFKYVTKTTFHDKRKSASKRLRQQAETTEAVRPLKEAKYAAKQQAKITEKGLEQLKEAEFHATRTVVASVDGKEALMRIWALGQTIEAAKRGEHLGRPSQEVLQTAADYKALPGKPVGLLPGGNSENPEETE